MHTLNLKTNYFPLMCFFTFCKITLHKKAAETGKGGTLLYLILHFECGMAIPTFLWGQVNYPKADLWLQKEFVGCNLPVPITVRRTVADPVRGSGRGPDPPPSGLRLFFITCLTLKVLHL